LTSPIISKVVGPYDIPKQTFFGNLRQDLHLKSLGRIANSQPNDVHAQYEFLSNLSQAYPEAVIDCFEQYKEFAVDERIALLYLNSLSRTGNVSKFGLKRFMDRLQQAGGVSMETIAALQDLSHSKLGKGELAIRASRVLSVGGGGGVTGGTGGVLSMSRGNSPNSPLFIQTHIPVKSTECCLLLLDMFLSHL
jgi:hypothetical protein